MSLLQVLEVAGLACAAALLFGFAALVAYFGWPPSKWGGGR